MTGKNAISILLAGVHGGLANASAAELRKIENLADVCGDGEGELSGAARHAQIVVSLPLS